LAYFEAARRAFYSQNLSTAYDSINRAIALMPDDASLHEFRALVLFAAGRYREAAEAVHAVLAVAPGWDWTTLSGLYRDNDTYVRQLLALAGYVRANPKEAGAQFLLAYHDITLGHVKAAATQLQSVLELDPNDRLAADLLDLISAEDDDTEPSADERPPTVAQLQGEWEARRPEGQIELDIKDDQFSWDYDLDDNDDEFRGKLVLAQDVLVLATPGGSQMVGRVSMLNDDAFTFRLIGNDDDDSGIVFERE
jgi:hypothetical protein